MASSAQIASPGVYVTDDVGVEVTDGSHSRVQLGLLPTGHYGLRVIAADGSTVIVDGSSSMFLISATGTQTVSVTSGTAANTTVTLSALGNQSNALAILGMPNTGGSTNAVGAGYYRWPDDATARIHFVASSSGGSPTAGWVRPDFEGWMSSELAGAAPNLPVVRLAGTSQFAGNTSVTGRYYVLAQAAL